VCFALFAHLTSVQSKAQATGVWYNIDLDEFRRLGVDKVYLSGEYPAIFFKEVKQFNDIVLKEIAHVHHLAWNYRRVMFLIIVSPTEIKIYNCSKKPFNYEAKEVNIEKELKNLELISCDWADAKNLKLVKELFSRIAVDSGLLWSTENVLRGKIDVQQRIDRYLVKSLLNAAKELKKAELNDEMIHSLLMRSIFIMYLEDKGAANETKLYTEISKDASSYLDILENKSQTYTLFKKVEEHFNGNVFPLIKGEERKVTQEHLYIIQKCLIDGDLSNNQKLFTWRLFRFDIIQIELLSEIYENFLEEFKEDKKEEAGQYYTPPSLVELILNEKLPTKNETNYFVKVLDPACGSGIFLVESFKRLIKRWKNANPNKQIEFKELRDILKENIYGIEYDKFAIRVTAFSLYLAIVEQLNPKTLWSDKRYKFPHLIYDPQDKNIEHQGKNLLRADTIGGVSIQDIPQMDLVVGNPPFGSKIKLRSIKEFCISHNFGQDMVIPFLKKSIDFAENGSIALIFNTKVLTNTERPFQNFRKWLLNEAYVEKVYNLSIFRKAPKTFGGQLFSSAVGPVSIAFYQKHKPKKPSNTIEYWAPKTYIKNSLVEGVVIDSTDIKFLPREECQKPNTKIWKVAMWGSFEDFKLLERLKSSYSSLKEYGTKSKIKNGVGFQLLTKKTDKPLLDETLARLKYIDADNIEPYYTLDNNLSKINDSIKTKKAISFYLEYYNKNFVSDLPKINVFRRLGDKNAYVSPHFIIKKGLKDGLTCASYLDYNCAFRDGVYGFYGPKENINSLKIITAFLNSSISNYYLFLSISSYGIERDQIMKNEYLEVPFALLSEKQSEDIVYAMDELINYKKENELELHVKLKKSIETVFFKSLNISLHESFLIEDCIKFNIDLFHKGIDSIALKAIEIKETKTYVTILCEIINEYLNSKIKLNAKVYDISKNDPLNLIVLKFSNSEKEIQEGNINEIKTHLNDLDRLTYSKEAQSIYMKKQIKYYDNDTIYVIKPNQKRFWNRSAAVNDAKELITVPYRDGLSAFIFLSFLYSHSL
jgi:type I restriction-modification system DNA methylase subunit